MKKKDEIPSEVEQKIEQFVSSLQAIRGEKPIPKSWGNHILISLGLKKKKGGQYRNEETELQIASDILRFELILLKTKPKISEKEIVDKWLEENQDEDGKHKKYRIRTVNRYLEIYRKWRGTAMGKIAGKQLACDMKKEEKARLKRFK
jgi:hypothetical protein